MRERLPMSRGFEVLEHTADIGVRAWGDSVEEAFEQAAWGMAEILGIRVAGGPGTAGAPATRRVLATGDDEGGLVVDLLNELLLLHETEEVAFADIGVLRVGVKEVEAVVRVVPLAGPPEGVPVKAATFHDLRVERGSAGRVEVRVFLDV
jgi:SHS2 domain-containing protein